jgi:hypothetical protein
MIAALLMAAGYTAAPGLRQAETRSGGSSAAEISELQLQNPRCQLARLTMPHISGYPCNLNRDIPLLERR